MENPVIVEDFTTKEVKEALEKPEKENMKTTGKKSEARHAESRYAEVPMSDMFCHICNKHMWDRFSFENHLRGRAHQLMMEKLDESYKLKVTLMRHELRVAEEQRELSLNNSKRRDKEVYVDFNMIEYCTTSVLNFYGTLCTHGKSEKRTLFNTCSYEKCRSMQGTTKKKEKLTKGEAEVRTAEDEEKDICNDTKNEKKRIQENKNKLQVLLKI